MKQAEKDLVIQNKLGLHARPAARLVQLANKFSSEILLERGDEKVNGKSIMGVLMLAAPQGTKLRVIARGEDAERAVREIEHLLAEKFGEE